MNLRFDSLLRLHRFKVSTVFVKYSTATNPNKQSNKTIDILKQRYNTDNWTNLTPKIISRMGTNLHTQKYHPLSFIRQRIVNYFNKTYKNRTNNPMFSVFDNISPVVTVAQNFDSLLIPKDHPSRLKTNCYYINQDVMLRAHTTAHQPELINMGLNNFLIVGEVFRRDQIDIMHFPIFHQMDAVRIYTPEELFKNVHDIHNLNLFEKEQEDSSEKQACHTLEAVKILEHDLKTTLISIIEDLFGKDVKYRWADQYFPFTHPSWELEIFYENEWNEICGCGIIRQEILEKAGATNRIGYAFGLGLDRLAMYLYGIPDIRWFWSTDSGFLSQFKVDDIYMPIKFKPVSKHPQCSQDMSLWLPEDGSFSSNDLYDIIREIGSDLVEQITLVDEFVHPKTNKTSHTYRIVYRHMERVLNNKEVMQIHNRIKLKAQSVLNVIPR